MNNRLTGILMVLVGIASIPILEGDATAAILMVPAGIFLAITGGEIKEE